MIITQSSQVSHIECEIHEKNSNLTLSQWNYYFSPIYGFLI